MEVVSLCYLTSYILHLFHLISELEARLCYGREIELRCGMLIPIKEGALMNMGSVGFLLSSNSEELWTKNEDERSCNEVTTDCGIFLRGSASYITC